MQRGVSRPSRKNHDFHCEMSPFLTAVPINNPISFAQPPRHFIFVLPCVHAPLFYSQEGDDETGMCIFLEVAFSHFRKNNIWPTMDYLLYEGLLIFQNLLNEKHNFKIKLQTSMLVGLNSL